MDGIYNPRPSRSKSATPGQKVVKISLKKFLRGGFSASIIGARSKQIYGGFYRKTSAEAIAKAKQFISSKGWKLVS